MKALKFVIAVVCGILAILVAQAAQAHGEAGLSPTQVQVSALQK